MNLPYTGSNTESKAVLLGNGSDGFPRAYAVHQSDFPTTGWQLAALLNAAYAKGYVEAQQDMQSALGIRRN